MKPHITVIALSVGDPDTALRFHRDGPGFRTVGIVGEDVPSGVVVFFALQGGMRPAPWPRDGIAPATPGRLPLASARPAWRLAAISPRGRRWTR